MDKLLTILFLIFPFLVMGIVGYIMSDGDIGIVFLSSLFGGLILFIIFGAIYSNTKGGKKDIEDAEQSLADTKKRFEDMIKTKFEEEKMEISQEYRDYNYSIVGLDENNRKVCFLNSNKKLNPFDYQLPHNEIIKNIQYSSRSFHYKDILESELIIDGETVTKTSRSSQVGGVILGGVLAGGVGAVIGGLSGKTSSNEKVKAIQLKIVVNDTREPLQIITFLNESKSIDRKNKKFIKANKEVMHWHSLFKVIIDLADKEDKDNRVKSNSSSLDIADEIRKLHDLFKEGIISKEEFELQKKKIIS